MRERILNHRLWNLMMLGAGIANVLAFIPQIFIVYGEKKVEGVSVGMFCIFMYIQITFAIQGYLVRSRVQMISMFTSAAMSGSIIAGTIMYRN